VHGWWFDRTAEYYPRRRHKTFGKFTHATEEELELTFLPCWRELSALEHQRRAAETVREIEVETRKRLEERNRSPMGAKRIIRQDPHDSPKRPSRSPAPRFHTATGAVRRRLESSFREFLEWYRQAAKELQAGNADVEFPPSCFRPRLPFARGRPNPIPG